MLTCLIFIVSDRFTAVPWRTLSAIFDRTWLTFSLWDARRHGIFKRRLLILLVILISINICDMVLLYLLITGQVRRDRRTVDRWSEWRAAWARWARRLATWASYIYLLSLRLALLILATLFFELWALLVSGFVLFRGGIFLLVFALNWSTAKQISLLALHQWISLVIWE